MYHILTYQINLSFHQNQHKIYDSDVLLIHQQQSIKSILFILFVVLIIFIQRPNKFWLSEPVIPLKLISYK